MRPSFLWKFRSESTSLSLRPHALPPCEANMAATDQVVYFARNIICDVLIGWSCRVIDRPDPPYTRVSPTFVCDRTGGLHRERYRVTYTVTMKPCESGNLVTYTVTMKPCYRIAGRDTCDRLVTVKTGHRICIIRIKPCDRLVTVKTAHRICIIRIKPCDSIF